MEGTVKPTRPQNPVYVYDPRRGKAPRRVQGTRTVVLSVYNLPAEIPLESSVFFSQVLKEFMRVLAAADFSRSSEDCLLPESLRRAVILFQGGFTPDYQVHAILRLLNRKEAL